MNKRILKLAVPAIFNNITIPLLGICDTTIAGHLGSAQFLAAMAVGSMMLNVIFWLCGFLRMGTTGLASQAYGAGSLGQVRLILKNAFLIALVLSCLVLIAQRPLENILFRIMAPESGVSESAALYFRICIWSAPAQLIIMCVSGWFIGLQNTVVPMLIAVGINILNIVLSILLVFVFDSGFAGIAFGTLIANWIGLGGALGFVVVRLKKLKSAENRSHAANSSFKIQPSTFFKVNTDLFLRSACIMIVTLAMTSYGSRLGETTLAANAVIMQFFLFFSYFMDGFAFAGEAMVGSALGARNYVLLSVSVRCLLKWGVAMAVSFFLIYLFGVPFITSLLTDNAEVLNIVKDMRFWVVALPPITVAAFIFDGVFIGLARTRALLVTTLIATLAYFAIVLTGNILTNILIWGAFETYLLLRGVLLGVDYVKLKRKMLTLQHE